MVCAEVVLDGRVIDVRLEDTVSLEKPVGLGTKQEHAELIPDTALGVHIEA